MTFKRTISSFNRSILGEKINDYPIEKDLIYRFIFMVDCFSISLLGSKHLNAIILISDKKYFIFSSVFPIHSLAPGLKSSGLLSYAYSII